VTLIDTGEATQTGGRLRRVRQHVECETFCFTYGDGIADVDIAASIRTHSGFGQPMDTLRDETRLEELWQTGAAPWKVWT